MEESEATGAPLINTSRFVMAAIEPVVERVRLVRVTAVPLGLFNVPCTAVTPETPVFPTTT